MTYQSFAIGQTANNDN